MRYVRAFIFTLLAAWAIGFELQHTVLPGLPEAVFGKVSSDVALLASAMICCGRGLVQRRWPWTAIGLGLLAWTAGDLYWTLVLYDLDSVPIPSWADAGYLAFLPLMFAGLVGLARGHLRELPATLWLDASVAACGAAALSAAAVLGRVGFDGHLLAVATNAAYPIGDLALLALIVGTSSLRGWQRDWSWSWLGVGVLVFWLADSLYLITNADGSYAPGSFFDVGWAVAGIMFAAAAWAPGQTRSAEVRDGGAVTAAISLAFALSSLGLLLFAAWGAITPLAAALAGVSLLAVCARLLAANRINTRLLTQSRKEATTDPLTGLGNRRRLTVALERAVRTADVRCPTVLVLFDLNGFKHYNDTFGHPAGDALLQRLALRLAAYVGDRGSAYRMGGDEFCVLVPAAAAEPHAVGAELAEALSEHGVGFTISASYGIVALPQDADSAEEALRLADQHMYAHKHASRASVSRQASRVLLTAMNEHSAHLADHTVEVARLAGDVAHRLGISRREVDDVIRAAELHDVGKLGVPDVILQKPGPLDEREWSVMRRHPEWGADMVSRVPGLEELAQLVGAHHERWDGRGYPLGLRGEAIPLASRVISVCDAFEAMVSRRPYRAPLSVDSALRELLAGSGSQFDPNVVAAVEVEVGP
jgi:two-component system cell cycle response regulator